MRKWRERARHVAINLGLLAAMWLLDRIGVLPRLYPRFEDGLPVGTAALAPAGVLLVMVTAVWALSVEWGKGAASGKAVPQVRTADE